MTHESSAIRIPPGTPRFSFSKRHPPLLTAEDGQRLVVATGDAAYRSLASDADVERADFCHANALTGPIAVAGAEPGDALAVTIEAIAVGDSAYTVHVAKWRRWLTDEPRAFRDVHRIAGDRIHLDGGGTLPVRPMIGCIGVAPAGEALSSLSPVARTGGNLDLRDLEPGATIWLPVEVQGALLSLGDLHAAMGEGEPMGAGFECAGEVALRVNVLKGRAQDAPRVVRDDAFIFIGVDPCDEAAAERMALRAAWRYLTVEAGLPSRRAFAVASAVLSVRPGGPAGAVRLARLDRALLKGIVGHSVP